MTATLMSDGERAYCTSCDSIVAAKHALVAISEPDFATLKARQRETDWLTVLHEGDDVMVVESRGVRTLTGRIGDKSYQLSFPAALPVRAVSSVFATRTGDDGREMAVQALRKVNQPVS